MSFQERVSGLKSVIQRWLGQVWRNRSDAFSIALRCLPLILVSLYSLQSWVGAARISNTYLSMMSISPTTYADRDDWKIASANLPATNIIRVLTEMELAESEKVLAFRQAEFAWYAGFPFVNVYDNQFVDLFDQLEPAGLLNRLHDAGIRYLAVPPYSMPEIYNSGFGALIGSSRFSELIYVDRGYRLFRVRDQIDLSTPEGLSLVEADYSAYPEELAAWYLGRQPQGIIQQLLDGRARISTNSDEGFVEISRTRSYRSRPDRVDVLQPSPLSPTLSPFMNGAGAFATNFGEAIDFEFELSGNGFVEISLVTTSQADLVDVEEDFVLWSGVLDDRRRIVSGQYVDLMVRPIAETLVDERRLLRLQVRLQDGGFVRLFGWRANAPVDDVNIASEISDYAQATDNGWTYVSDGARERRSTLRDGATLDLSGPRRRDLSFGATRHDVANAPLEIIQQTEVHASQYDSRPVSVLSPLFYADPEVYASLDRNYATSTFASVIEPVVTAEHFLAGNGLIDATAIITCEAEQVYERPLGSFALYNEVSRSDELEFRVPCIPKFVQFSYTLRRNTALVFAPSLSDVELGIGAVNWTMVYADGRAQERSLNRVGSILAGPAILENTEQANR